MPSLSDIQNLIVQDATQQGLNPALALAVCEVESSFNPSAINPNTGAIGLFQLMPATAGDLGVDPYDWQQNVDGGTRYLSMLSSHYPGRPDLILAAYNWGLGNVNRMIWGSTGYPPGQTIQAFSTSQVMSSVPSVTANYINQITSLMVKWSNDPILLGVPGTDNGGGVDITNGDQLVIIGVVVGVMLLWVMLKR
jgi:soluble lytic murein transglycosylase-like protein